MKLVEPEVVPVGTTRFRFSNFCDEGIKPVLRHRIRKGHGKPRSQVLRMLHAQYDGTPHLCPSLEAIRATRSDLPLEVSRLDRESRPVSLSLFGCVFPNMGQRHFTAGVAPLDRTHALSGNGAA